MEMCNYWLVQLSNMVNSIINSLIRYDKGERTLVIGDKDDKMIHKQKFPSPHPEIELSLITFDQMG